MLKAYVHTQKKEKKRTFKMSEFRVMHRKTNEKNNIEKVLLLYAMLVGVRVHA